MSTEKKVVNRKKNYSGLSTEKKVVNRKKNYSGFEIYIKKVLKEVHPDTQITRFASDQLTDFVIIMTREIGRLAVEACKRQKVITITSKYIVYSVTSIIPGELLIHALEEGKKATDLLKIEVPKGTKAKKYGTLSVPRVTKLLRKFMYRVSQPAAVFTTAVIEYLLAEILELAGNGARDSKKIKITARHLFEAVFNDEELANMFNKLKIEFSDGGVTRWLDESLIPSEEKKGKNASVRSKEKRARGAVPSKGGRRALPGTKALREIRRYQKSVGLLGSKTTFIRPIREVCLENSQKVRFSNGVTEQFQQFCEIRIISILRDAQRIAINGKREGVTSSDVSLAFAHCKDTFNNSHDTIKNELLPPTVKRMARRAGVKRISSEAIEKAREYYSAVAYTICRGLMSDLTLTKAKTVSAPTLKGVLQNLGYNFLFSLKK